MPQYISKLILNGVTQMDVTQDTVAANNLLSGETATKNDGSPVVGAYVPASPTMQTKSVTPTESSQTVSPDTGYDGLSSVSVGAISSTYVGSQVARNDSTDLTASGATVTAPAGYYASAASKSVASGSATPAASISGTSATVSTGTNTLTLSKTVSNTPQVSAGYVSSGTAGNSNVSLTANVTTKAATTYHPSSSQQTIASDTYLTGTQTINAVTTTNLIAENIKSGVTVTVGDTSEPDIVTSVTGTYTGGGSELFIGTSDVVLDSVSSSITFTGLLAEPTSFVISPDSSFSTSNPPSVAAVVFDGTSMHGQTATTTSNANASYDTGFTKSYSNGTLTITATTARFQADWWILSYTYGGGTIATEDVQVGSGVTSISFTGLDDEPAFWSCIFKSNFGTSSGYQRVMFVRQSGSLVFGCCLDSSVTATSSYWTSSYSNGTLTISSNGTNQGGYFHQPGYYQLTYAIDSSGNYQSKTVTPTTSQQEITADSGYDALKKVTVNAMPSMTLPSSASSTSSGTQKATITPTTSAQYLNIPTGYNGTAQYYTIAASGGGGTLTVATKTATLSAVGQTLSFTGLSGTPKCWFVKTTSQISSSGSTTIYYITDGFWDGTSVKGNSFRIGSTRRIYSWTSGVTQSFSGGTLTITGGSATGSSPGQFFNGNYELTYVY